MKKLLLKSSLVALFLSVAIGAIAQNTVTFEETFTGTTISQFVDRQNAPAWTFNQSGGKLSITMAGNDQWDNVAIIPNVNGQETTLAMTTSTPIVIRARKIPAANPDTMHTSTAVLSIGVLDADGFFVNNEWNTPLQADLTEEFVDYTYQIRSFSRDWNQADIDSNRIARFEIRINAGFATIYPNFDSQGDSVKKAYEGIVEIENFKVEDVILSTNRSQFVDNLFDIYPNPSNELVHFNFNQTLVGGNTPEITLYDNLGNTVISGSYSNGVLTGLDKGIYLVTVKAGNTFGQKKLVIF